MQYKSVHLVDPTLDEEDCAGNRTGSGHVTGHMTVVYLPSLDEVTAIQQSGCMQPDELMTVLTVQWYSIIERLSSFNALPLHPLYVYQRVGRLSM